MTTTRCGRCDRHIDTRLGLHLPARYAHRTGTADNPLAPGDFDDVCAPCDYGGPAAH